MMYLLKLNNNMKKILIKMDKLGLSFQPRSITDVGDINLNIDLKINFPEKPEILIADVVLDNMLLLLLQVS